ncbi:hypothetical protein HMPREF0973_00337 [Prevotella veroralis F0319]|uniref:Uncharacterized protein n=1 Tax=Prevotella veroralis F0319 TaxID=649761 RepID=C9ML63_9BACT|nr:hypothetical protein HMPREF0973_02799 [Prevotella veroralis F0319]EEX19396.1 hypothetical protein HMPREF0973_00337 [Prevotella veroralis F0319]
MPQPKRTPNRIGETCADKFPPERNNTENIAAFKTVFIILIHCGYILLRWGKNTKKERKQIRKCTDLTLPVVK